jgi:thioredoxin 1
MAIAQITDNNFKEQVLSSSLPVLVDFWAPWCGPCKMAEPALEELSTQFAGKLQIVKVNVDDNPQMSGQLGVMSIPTTILFKNGQEVGRQIGFAGKGAFEDLIKKGVI